MTIIENKEFWELQIEKLKVSGLTRKQYCRENGIDYVRFGYWLKRLSQSSSALVPVKVQTTEITKSKEILCTLELRGHLLKIHDISVLAFILDRIG